MFCTNQFKCIFLQCAVIIFFVVVNLTAYLEVQMIHYETLLQKIFDCHKLLWLGLVYNKNKLESSTISIS